MEHNRRNINLRKNQRRRICLIHGIHKTIPAIVQIIISHILPDQDGPKPNAILLILIFVTHKRSNIIKLRHPLPALENFLKQMGIACLDSVFEDISRRSGIFFIESSHKILCRLGHGCARAQNFRPPSERLIQAVFNIAC